MPNRANSLDGKTWLQNSFSIWRSFPRDQSSRDHPAAFPVALARRLIDCFAADKDGIALDPFVGSGSTLLAASEAGMKSVGIDINPAYREVFLNRLRLANLRGPQWEYLVGDVQQVARGIDSESVEIGITSPPYWNILNRRRSVDGQQRRPYTTSSRDLGNMSDYGEFVEALADVVNEVTRTLKSQRYFILNVMDIRQGSVFYPLHQDVCTRLHVMGALTLEDIIIWDRQADYNNMRPLGYPYKFIINKVHEYLLVFRKVG